MMRMNESMNDENESMNDEIGVRKTKQQGYTMQTPNHAFVCQKLVCC